MRGFYIAQPTPLLMPHQTKGKSGLNFM